MVAARVRYGIIIGTLGLAVLAGLIWLAPAAHGQVVVAQEREDQRPDLVRRIEVVAGRGSSIGVSVRDVEPGEVQKLGLPKALGAVIESVEEGSPADKAGFKRGDVVVTFDGEAVRGARQFARLVEETPSSREVEASVRRDGALTDVRVTPESGTARFGWGRAPEGFRAMPGFPAAPYVPDVPDMSGFETRFERMTGQGTLGVSVQELSGDLPGYFGVTDGLLVSSVRAASPAATAGLKPGDVITAVNGEAVEDAAELRRRLREAGSGEVTLSVTRDRKPLSLKAAIETPERQSTRRPRWSA